jgi:hypothetical protein
MVALAMRGPEPTLDRRTTDEVRSVGKACGDGATRPVDCRVVGVQDGDDVRSGEHGRDLEGHLCRIKIGSKFAGIVRLPDRPLE